MNNPNGTTQIPMDKITSSKRNFENCNKLTRENVQITHFENLINILK
jgi:hypothetical protein